MKKFDAHLKNHSDDSTITINDLALDLVTEMNIVVNFDSEPKVIIKSLVMQDGKPLIDEDGNPLFSIREYFINTLHISGSITEDVDQIEFFNRIREKNELARQSD